MQRSVFFDRIQGGRDSEDSHVNETSGMMRKDVPWGKPRHT